MGQHANLRMTWHASLAALPLLVGVATATAATPDLSGIWELRYDSRSVPQASLTPAARQAAAKHLYNDLDSYRWCRIAGMPVQMDAPQHMVQGKTEIAIVTPMHAIARHVYIDGRAQVSLDDYDPTTVGNSIGTWDGDTLVVNTIGFSDRGIVSIPGGGFRTPKSQLVERYRLLDEGKVLSVSFTWTDAAVFARPHSYEFRYHRAPPGTNITEWPCEPQDDERGRFFAPALESYKK